jgi:hypothetical protein
MRPGGHRTFFPVWGRELRQKVSQCEAGGQLGRWLRAAEERISDPASSGALSCSRASCAGWLELSLEAM